MSANVEFFRIQYRLRKITKAKLKAMVTAGAITQEEYEYIISA